MKPRSFAAVLMSVGCATRLTGGDVFGEAVVGSGDKDDLFARLRNARSNGIKRVNLRRALISMIGLVGSGKP